MKQQQQAFKPELLELKGKLYPTYAWVLDEAHNAGLLSLTIKINQMPNDTNGNVAIVTATATDADGRKFTDVGDASPESVNSMIKPHIIRMASTRAKGRALRDMINCGMTLAEELDWNKTAPAPAPVKPTTTTEPSPQSDVAYIAEAPAKLPTALPTAPVFKFNPAKL